MAVMPTTPRRPKTPTALAPTVRFEVFHNGARLARAGMPGAAVVSVTLHWVRRKQERLPKGGNIPLEELGFVVGALDSNDPAWSRIVRWKTPTLKVGDRVEVRLSKSQLVDPPSYEEKHRIQKRPEPPVEGDPARVRRRHRLARAAWRLRECIESAKRRTGHAVAQGRRRPGEGVGACRGPEDGEPHGAVEVIRPVQLCPHADSTLGKVSPTMRRQANGRTEGPNA